MPELEMIMTAQQARELIANFACGCGYRPKPGDMCFERLEDGFLFDCPGCGDRWELREAGRVN